MSEPTTTNALSNPGSFVKFDGDDTNPVTSNASNVSFFDVKEEGGVEVEEENDGDIPGTGEDLNGAFEDDDAEDDDEYEDDDDDDDDDDEEYVGP